MATPARALAFSTLLRLEAGRATLADLLADAPLEALARGERDFLHELVLGSLRRRGAIDFALAPLVDRPPGELDAPVRIALRLGAHQLLHLRVPARAAVFESVELVRERLPRAAGLVNAVLRRLSRQGPPAWPSSERDPLAWLTSEGSLPRWLAARWIRRLGPATAIARARAFLDQAPTVFRVNPRRAESWPRVEAALRPRPLAVPGAFEAGAGRAAELARESVLYLQDQGSQLVARLAATPGLVLDACAAPGGKALLIADVSGAQTRVIAAEASWRRLRTLRVLVGRWGASSVLCVGADARFPPFAAAFDAVLLDAPCSGLGTLARNPDIRWRASPDDLERQASRQRQLLGALAPFVREGGILVYATCSLEPEETLDVVGAFLAERRDFSPAPLPAWAGGFAEGPFAATRPERHAGDGFFAAPLRRS